MAVSLPAKIVNPVRSYRIASRYDVLGDGGFAAPVQTTPAKHRLHSTLHVIKAFSIERLKSHGSAIAGHLNRVAARTWAFPDLGTAGPARGSKIDPLTVARPA